MLYEKKRETGWLPSHHFWEGGEETVLLKHRFGGERGRSIIRRFSRRVLEPNLTQPPSPHEQGAGCVTACSQFTYPYLSQDTAVNTLTKRWSEQSHVRTPKGTRDIFPSLKTSRPTLGTTHPCSEWVPRFYPGANRPGRVMFTNHSACMPS